MRREALVEVRREGQDSRSFMVARSRLMKSRIRTMSDYVYALFYIVRLYDRTNLTPIAQRMKETPTLRLQAWFGFEEAAGGSFSYGQGRYFDVDPDSWSQIWNYADRFLLTTSHS